MHNDLLMDIRVVSPVEIINVAPGIPVPGIDAIVEEQDTNLLLGTGATVKDTAESYKSLVRKMNKQQPRKPGDIIVRKTQPLRIIAVVYDIEQYPICREEWLESALGKLLDQCDLNEIKTLSMPLLGMAYGKIDRTIPINVIKSTLTNRSFAHLEKIYITINSQEN